MELKAPRKHLVVMKTLLGLSSVLLVLTACGSSGASGSGAPAPQVPTEFKAACGRPGTEVRVDNNEGFVRHEDCDLTGVVVVRADGRGGAVVPAPGESVSNSVGLTIERAANGDVVFDARQ